MTFHLTPLGSPPCRSASRGLRSAFSILDAVQALKAKPAKRWMRRLLKQKTTKMFKLKSTAVAEPQGGKRGNDFPGGKRGMLSPLHTSHSPGMLSPAAQQDRLGRSSSLSSPLPSRPFTSPSGRRPSVTKDEALRVAIGVTSGTAFCGCVGTQKRCEYSVMGPSVNLAARLMSACGKYGANILVDDELRKSAVAHDDKLQPAFSFRAFDPVPVKGYDAPVAFYHPTRTQAGVKASAAAAGGASSDALEREPSSRERVHSTNQSRFSRRFSSMAGPRLATLRRIMGDSSSSEPDPEALRLVVKRWTQRSLYTAFNSWANRWEAVNRSKAVLAKVVGRMRNRLLFVVFEGWLVFVEMSQDANVMGEGSGHWNTLDQLNLREMTAAKIASVISVSLTSFSRSAILELHPAGSPLLVETALSRLCALDILIADDELAEESVVAEIGGGGGGPSVTAAASGTDALYTFADPELATHIYETMTLQQRKRLHISAGEWIRRCVLVRLESYMATDAARLDEKTDEMANALCDQVRGLCVGAGGWGVDRRVW